MATLDKLKAWAAGHKKQLAAGGAAAVAGVAYWRTRHPAAAPSGVTVTPAASPDAEQATTDAYNQFTDAVNQFGAQTQAGQQAIIDSISQAYGAQQQAAGQAGDQTAAMLAQLAAQQQTTAGQLSDTITGALAQLTQPAEPAAAVAPRKPSTNYAFKAGDTIASVAARNGLTVEQLLAANPDSGPAFGAPGHRIYIPAAAAAPGPARPTPTISYTFTPGDTAASVAKQFGLTVAQLHAANPTSGPAFDAPGHRITIPGH